MNAWEVCEEALKKCQHGRKSREKTYFLKLLKNIVDQNQKIIECAQKIIFESAEQSTKQETSHLESEKSNMEVDSNESSSQRAGLRSRSSGSVSQVTKPTKKPLRKLVWDNIFDELIEVGHCDFPIATQKSYSDKVIQQSRLIINSILRRYRAYESPKGGSAYKLILGKNPSDSNGLHICKMYCINRYRYNCEVRLIFEYDVEKRLYKFYRIGKHNHKFECMTAGAKWDEILDKSEPPEIEILSTKCRY